MTIHREGRTLLLILLVGFTCLNVATYALGLVPFLFWSILGVSVFFFLLILQFFRNPIFTINREEGTILAPADGKVVVIEEVLEPEFLKDKRIQVSIFMSPVNVHVNRMPIGGVIDFYRYHAGKYLVAWHPKSSTENERTTVVVNTGKHQILFRQIAGALARRIKCYVSEGQALNQGDEFGFIKFGSRVDVFLPLGTEITTSLGEVTKGGRTVIARIAK